MSQILHGSARTTAAARREIQHSQESLRALAKRYGVNQKTIAKWRKGGKTQLFRVVNGGHGGLLSALPPALVVRTLTGRGEGIALAQLPVETP